MNLLINLIFLAPSIALGLLWYLRKRAMKKVLEFRDPKEGHDYGVQLVYESNGVRWYGFKNPLMMPAPRATMAEIAMNNAAMNMTDERLKEYFSNMRIYANKGQITKVMAIIDKMEDRLNWACEEETLNLLAMCYFFVEGEDIVNPSPADMERKKRLLDADDQAKFFFMHTALKVTKNYSAISDQNFQTYLMEKRIQNMTSMPQ